MSITKVSSLGCNPSHLKLNSNKSNLQYAGNVVSTSPNSLNNPSLNNLQAYYLQPNTKANIPFGRLRIEHLENGAYVDKAKNVCFKLFTFENVERVFVEIKDKGLHELEKVEDGIFKKTLGKDLAKHGDDYRFKLVKEGGEEVFVKDPYAMRCKDLSSEYAQIYNHNEFKWNDDAWMSNKVSQKISRKSDSNGLLPLNKVKIYEGNIPTLTKEGNFKAAQAKIDELAKDKTFNTIHIMPVESTYSYNWGYDGVLKFAPQESQMGGPDELKKLIDYAHSKKINVIMDVVPNHLGPDGNTLSKTGPYVKQGGPFGDSLNYEGDSKNNKHVRDYMTNACLNWVENYHCDGLRLDMTKFMGSDNALKQIAMEVHYHNPDAIIIAEDGRDNMYKLTQPLSKTEEAIGEGEQFHANQIKNIDNNNISLDNLGLDSEWDFPFHHALKDVLEHGSVYNYAMTRKFSGSRIKYMMSHDEIGNMDGTRLITKLASARMNMFNKVEGANNCEKGQRAAHAAHAILASKASGEFDKMTATERLAFLKSHHVVTDVTPKEVKNVLDYSIAQNKLGLGAVLTSPGPNMVFQGDEKGALEYFKFFRQFSPGNAEKDLKDLSDKGYEPGIKAFMDSKLGAIPYSNEAKETMAKLNQFTKDLSKLRDENEALSSGEFGFNDVIHENSKVLGSHLKKGVNEIFTVNNFNDASYSGNYGIQLPKGKWQEVINSNDAKYAGTGEFKNLAPIETNGEGNVGISLPPIH